VLNLNRVGITSNAHGAFFDRYKKGPGFMHSNRGKGGVLVPGRVTLAVEDPIDSTNDTARGSFNMRLVRQVRGFLGLEKEGCFLGSGVRGSFKMRVNLDR
jgi:hypothetical protein